MSGFRSRKGWTKHPGPGRCGARWTLDCAPGFQVQHCGHPTANYPYLGFRADGSLVGPEAAPHFAFLRECQEAVERAWAEAEVERMNAKLQQLGVRVVIGKPR